jgi:hypothetical protein
MALGLHVVDPPAGGQLVEGEAGEVGVAREGADVEVHAVVDHVRVTPILQGLDHRDLLRDVVGRPRFHVRLQAPEPAAVVLPLARVGGRDLGRRLAGGGGRRLDLVVALVGVGHQVAHVGDVDDVGDLVASRQEHPTQQVWRHDLAAHVAERLWRVDGGSARVDPHPRRLQRLEPHERPGARVVEPQLLQAGRRRAVGHPPIMADRLPPPTPQTCVQISSGSRRFNTSSGRGVGVRR